MTAVTVDASYIIICFLFKKRCCFIYCRWLPSHETNVSGNSNTFVLAAGRLALSDTVFIIANIIGDVLSSFCRSLHCLKVPHACYRHDCWSFRAFLEVFGTFGYISFGGLRGKAFLLTKESFRCTASWQCVFLPWWLLMQAQAGGHCSFFPWTFPSFQIQNLIKANCWDTLYLFVTLHPFLVAVYIGHKVTRAVTSLGLQGAPSGKRHPEVVPQERQADAEQSNRG